MYFRQTLRQVQKTSSRYLKVYAEGRARQPSLEPFSTPAAAITFAANREISEDERASCTEALVAEHQRSKSPLWQILLTHVFEPMLLAMRRNMGSPGNEDFDQRLYVAFLDALRSENFSGSKPFVSIYRATQEALDAARRNERFFGGLYDDDELPDTEYYEVAGELDRQTILHTLAELPDMADELLDLAAATIVGDELLTEFVERNYPDLDERERRVTCVRLQRARANIAIAINARFGAICCAPRPPRTTLH